MPSTLRVYLGHAIPPWHWWRSQLVYRFVHWGKNDSRSNEMDDREGIFHTPSPCLSGLGWSSDAWWEQGDKYTHNYTNSVNVSWLHYEWESPKYSLRFYACEQKYAPDRVDHCGLSHGLLSSLARPIQTNHSYPQMSMTLVKLSQILRTLIWIDTNQRSSMAAKCISFASNCKSFSEPRKVYWSLLPPVRAKQLGPRVLISTRSSTIERWRLRCILYLIH